MFARAGASGQLFENQRTRPFLRSSIDCAIEPQRTVLQFSTRKLPSDHLDELESIISRSPASLDQILAKIERPYNRTRLDRIFQNANIRSAFQLTDLTEKDFLHNYYAGCVNLKLLKDAMAQFGLSFKK